MKRPVGLVVSVATVVALAALGTAAADELGEGAGTARAFASPSSSNSDHRTLARRLTIVLGRSVDGRPIRAERIGNASNEHPVLVVGCIHGSEGAGIAIARDLMSDPSPRGELLWVIPDLNPDGFAAGTRTNADGVDLNRNFPWRWRPLDAPGSLFYSGLHALSEPESRLAHRFILERRPTISIWFHQHAGLVDRSGGRIAIERRLSRMTGLPLQTLPRYPGSVTGWENHTFPGTTAFVVELPAGSLSAFDVERFSDAILRLI